MAAPLAPGVLAAAIHREGTKNTKDAAGQRIHWTALLPRPSGAAP